MKKGDAMTLDASRRRSRTEPASGCFRHEAFLYGSDAEYADVGAAFLSEGLVHDEAMLVVAAPERIALLRSALGRDARRVEFAEVTEIGRNPARIIPAWRDFVARQIPGRKLRGIGEPVWSEQSEAELVECYRHESLLNLAFAGEDFQLVCPYDTRTLDPAILHEAHASHPMVRAGAATLASDCYEGVEAIGAAFTPTLPGPPGRPRELQIERTGLPGLRNVVFHEAAAGGMEPGRVQDLVLAVNELATNSLLHAGGYGLVGCWWEGNTMVVEVRDGGFIEDPLAGRVRPAPEQDGGRGLWLVNQICDLTQIRTSPSGTIVRVYMSRS